jgi:hypothetical protein
MGRFLKRASGASIFAPNFIAAFHRKSSTVQMLSLFLPKMKALRIQENPVRSWKKPATERKLRRLEELPAG